MSDTYIDNVTGLTGDTLPWRDNVGSGVTITNGNTFDINGTYAFRIAFYVPPDGDNHYFHAGDKVTVALTLNSYTHRAYFSLRDYSYQPGWSQSRNGWIIESYSAGTSWDRTTRNTTDSIWTRYGAAAGLGQILVTFTTDQDRDGFNIGWGAQNNDESSTASAKANFTLNYISVKGGGADTDPYANIDGESDLTGDTVAIPGDPALSVTSTGIVGLFSPTAAQMQNLADFMWTDFGGTGTTVEDILSEIVQALKRSISNPLDYVIGLNIIPSQGLSKGSSKVIRFGFISSNVSMPELTSQFFTVDCGTLSFDYLCGNTFLDYAPYSKFSIYLPYIGVKEVDANDFVGHTIGVKYKGDVVTGGLTAFITKDGSVMYQYSGSCALNIPLTADNWGSTISAAINVATAVVGAASVPGAGLAASAGAAGKAAVGATVSNVAANPSLLSPQVSRSGAISGGAGAIGVQRPFVIRESVRFHSTANFNTLTGYPSYYFRSLADVTGYTVVYDCHLENIPATDGEIREIERLLEGGVIL